MGEFADRFPSSIFAEYDSLFKDRERKRERERGGEHAGKTASPFN